MRRNLSVAVALLATAAAHDAGARPSEPAAPPTADRSPAAPSSAPPPAPANGNIAPHSDWHVVQYLGAFGTSHPHDTGGATLGGSFRIRNGPLVAGVLMEFAGNLIQENGLGVAVAMGVAARPWSRLRLELLGTLGVHHYEGVGRDFIFGNDPGTNGTSGYGGARGVVGYIFGRRAYHFELGAYADYQNDFSRDRHVYEYPTTGGLFDGDGTGDHVVGASRLGFGLELGATHDLL